ncbi:RluA family pseudouridine synthase [Acidisphaera sp. L21]|uniref:RluA family pseudouridine synthase n=1 Tax=Acidisphaera sp. L21 TaxID=1641851 RepID=UPI00131B947F|nr:RluA family pseudouridine synthase [Acidisphaera sp. L21]
MGVTIQTVSDDDADIRLDRFLRRHYPALTQGALQKLCRTGQIRVDGRRVEASARLVPGQAVRVPPGMPAAPDERPPSVTAADVKEMERMVLHRDDQLIVLNKPSGLATQGGPGITRHLDGMLDALRDGGDRPRLVHRLDRDTSGVIVLARTPGMAAKLAASFRTREVEKTYWAVVVGNPNPESGQIDQPLKRVTGLFGDRTVATDRKDKEGQRAYTNYRLLDAAGRKLSWLELQPLTGRTHQLRVHCVSLGTVIVGDEKYSEPRDNGSGGSFVEGLADRLHLHARSILLPHPAGGTLEVAADLPPHMRDSFNTLGFQAPSAPAVTRLLRDPR